MFEVWSRTTKPPLCATKQMRVCISAVLVGRPLFAMHDIVSARGRQRSELLKHMTDWVAFKTRDASPTLQDETVVTAMQGMAVFCCWPAI